MSRSAGGPYWTWSDQHLRVIVVAISRSLCLLYCARIWSLRKQMKRRAIIFGGSTSGLFSAALLRQIGWDVDVYERSRAELVGRGAGITGHPELFETLEASGAGTKDLGVQVPRRIAIDRNGRVTEDRPLRQILTLWDRLHRLLRATFDQVHYHLGRDFERVEQDERGVRVRFSDGGIEHADILVGATVSARTCADRWRRM